MSGPHFIVTSTAKEHADYLKRKQRKFNRNVFLVLILTLCYCGVLYYILDNGLLQ